MFSWRVTLMIGTPAAGAGCFDYQDVACGDLKLDFACQCFWLRRINSLN